MGFSFTSNKLLIKLLNKRLRLRYQLIEFKLNLILIFCSNLYTCKHCKLISFSCSVNSFIHFIVYVFNFTKEFSSKTLIKITSYGTRLIILQKTCLIRNTISIVFSVGFLSLCVDFLLRLLIWHRGLYVMTEIEFRLFANIYVHSMKYIFFYTWNMN